MEISFIDAGNFRFFNNLQFKNAYILIFCTVSGITTSDSAVQLANIPATILILPLFNVAFFSAVQPLKTIFADTHDRIKQRYLCQPCTISKCLRPDLLQLCRELYRLNT